MIFIIDSICLSTRYNIETWDKAVRRMQHRFIGHVQRFELYDKKRLAYLVLQWRCVDWLKSTESRRGGQEHGRRFRVWRYEWQISQRYRLHSWKPLALNREEWGTNFDKIAYRKRLHP